MKKGSASCPARRSTRFSHNEIALPTWRNSNRPTRNSSAWGSMKEPRSSFTVRHCKSWDAIACASSTVASRPPPANATSMFSPPATATTWPNAAASVRTRATANASNWPQAQFPAPMKTIRNQAPTTRLPTTPNQNPSRRWCVNKESGVERVQLQRVPAAPGGGVNVSGGCPSSVSGIWRENNHPISSILSSRAAAR
ncbi:MAG: DUF2275 domain-containing protein [Planctomycetaceae bacterium]|nr:DUF2275 domain-containing protein [Planctomycetaceae bacterium]